MAYNMPDDIIISIKSALNEHCWLNVERIFRLILLAFKFVVYKTEESLLIIQN